MPTPAEGGPGQAALGAAGERGSPGLLVGLLRGVGALLQRMPRTVAWAPALAWAAAIWWLSSWTPASRDQVFHWKLVTTNLAHAPVFGLLALFLCLSLPRRAGWPRLERRTVTFVLTAVLLYAAVDELHQGFTPGRNPSVLDVLTDLTGAACTVWIVAYVGGAGASGQGLARRLFEGVFCCLVAALVATFVPMLFPEAAWL